MSRLPRYGAFGSFFSRPVSELLLEVPKRPAFCDQLDEATLKSLSTAYCGWYFRNAPYYSMSQLSSFNHGAFGHTLRFVFDEAAQWRKLLEENPVAFYDRQLFPHLAHSISSLASMLQVPPAAVSLIPNVTTGLNSVATSMLTGTQHSAVVFDITYGASKKIFGHAAKRCGGALLVQQCPTPISASNFLTAVEAAAAYLPRVIVLDAVTSNTAAVVPIAEAVSIVRRVSPFTVVVVDAAHALFGQPSGVGEVMQRWCGGVVPEGDPSHPADNPAVAERTEAGGGDADDPGGVVVLGNLHKWCGNARGCGWMCVSPSLRSRLFPAVLSHGADGSFHDRFLWDGVRDYAAALTVPSLLTFWEAVGPRRLYKDMCEVAEEGVEVWAEEIASKVEGGDVAWEGVLRTSRGTAEASVNTTPSVHGENLSSEPGGDAVNHPASVGGKSVDAGLHGAMRLLRVPCPTWADSSVLTGGSRDGGNAAGGGGAAADTEAVSRRSDKMSFNSPSDLAAALQNVLHANGVEVPVKALPCTLDFGDGAHPPPQAVGRQHALYLRVSGAPFLDRGCFVRAAPAVVQSLTKLSVDE